jgi:putative transposase
MQVIKSISAREFFKLYPEIRKRYFWGGKLRTQSYFVETIGNANEETIRKYVQDQLIELDSKEMNIKQLGLFLKLGRSRPRYLSRNRSYQNHR